MPSFFFVLSYKICKPFVEINFKNYLQSIGHISFMFNKGMIGNLHCKF